MADFELDPSDLSSTRSLVEKIGSHFYPNGEVVVKNTTMSQLPMEDRTLRSADPAKILQGDGIYRNPAFVVSAYAQTTQSALHGILAAQSDINDDMIIRDPNDPSGTNTLTGAAARQEIMRQSIMTSGLAPSGFQSTMKALNNEIINQTTLPNTENSSVTSSDGTTFSHSFSGYESAANVESFNGGSRAIALVDNLTETEKQIYKQKIAELHKKVNFQGSVSEFVINFNQNSAGQNLASLGFDIIQTGTFFGGNAVSYIPVGKEYLGTGQKTCFVAAALIEMLLQITNTIYIGGGTGTHRTIIGPNFSALSAENNSVSDHSFGRGFDISFVGDTADKAIKLSTNIDSYRRGLDMFLSTLQKLPRELHPDLIIVHDQLASELGILETGLESTTAAVRTKYKGLSPYINFSCDASHRDHIHVSFGPQRAGSFLTPTSPEVISKMGSGGEPVTVVNTGITSVNFDKFKTSYYNKEKEQLSPDEVMNLLVSTGLYSDEVAAIFVGIAERESRFTPYSLNTNRSTGDFSFGLFQANLLPQAQGKKNFFLKYPKEETVLGLKLAYATEPNLNITELSAKVKSSASRSTADQRIFIPYNQAYMVAVVAAGPEKAAERIRNNTKFDGYLFGPWGDYKGTYGFIYNVKFSTIESAYTRSGKKVDALKAWIRKKFQGNKPYPFIEEWMDGQVYEYQ